MNPQLERDLDRWLAARVIDLSTVERIRRFEAEQPARARLRWPTILALAFGGLMLAAGVLLFVAAHWENLSPGSRFALVLIMTGAFHVGGAVTHDRFRKMAIVLHGIGTATLGAGIFLAAQIFNLNENWANGVLLWAVGAAIAWWLLRDFVQAALVAVLAPAWLVSEWIARTEYRRWQGDASIWSAFVFLTALVYFTCISTSHQTLVRRTLRWIGAIVLLPAALLFLGTAFDNITSPCRFALRFLRS
jgi:uncharacterized membrane protein